MTSVTCIIATTGERPQELGRALASVAQQRGEDVVETIVVVDGGPSVDAPGARVIALAERSGPVHARNRAVAEARGDLLLFLDDDARYATDDVIARCVDRFRADPHLGIVSMRIIDPEGRPPQRRHVPRLRAGDPERSSVVTTFLEGACAIRRTVFEQVGPYPEEFVFGHEATDLAWRAIDAGWSVEYDGDLVVEHPALPPTRHPNHHYRTARNRALLVRRRLPVVLAVAHLVLWFAIEAYRARSGSALRAYARGYTDGLRARGVERRPMSWRTVWRMTLAGRPPIV